jgi:hypothetical protein
MYIIYNVVCNSSTFLSITSGSPCWNHHHMLDLQVTNLTVSKMPFTSGSTVKPLVQDMCLLHHLSGWVRMDSLKPA